MPELPEVQTVLNGLQKAISGKAIKDIDTYYPGTVIYSNDLPEGLFPRRLTGFERRGKYILIGLEGGLSLIIHLRMTGKLIYNPNPGDIVAHERARIWLEGGEAVHFVDIRTFGKIILCHTDNRDSRLPCLGPEPLGKEFNATYLSTALKGRKAPIKNALLDQKLIAGLGNIYVLEILYRAGIDPRRPASDITTKEIRALVRHTRQVLSEALAANGTTVSDFRSIDDKTGDFQNFLRVYQKKTCPKGHQIEVIKQAGRSSFFCPICQH